MVTFIGSVSMQYNFLNIKQKEIKQGLLEWSTPSLSSGRVAARIFLKQTAKGGLLSKNYGDQPFQNWEKKTLH